jgi:signal transduction histidine kinase
MTPNAEGAGLEVSLLSGVAAFRWVAWVWMTVVVAVTSRDLARPWLAFALVGIAFTVTATLTVWLRPSPRSLLGPWPVAAELACGLGVVIADGWAYEHGHVFGPSQTLGVVWPLSGVLMAGIALGPVAGVVAGAAFGPARLFDALANGVHTFDGHRVLSMASTALVYGLAGAIVGYITRLLRRAREEVAAAKAREDVARTLHDGVLQTLAAIERRTVEPQIARLARDQERELRDYLFSARNGQRRAGDLAVALRQVASRFEATFEGRAELLVPDDIPRLAAAQVQALAGAVGEALANAGKHGRAGRVTIYVEPAASGGVFCSVKDDGIGFDPSATVEGVGLSGSVRARVLEAGGRAEVHSVPGEGTEVCVWMG